jgi:hypothetical protein
MSNGFSVSPGRDHLSVHLPAFRDPQDYRRWFDLTARACDEHHCYKLLVDITDNPRPLPVTDLYDLGGYARQVAGSGPYRIAILAREEAVYPDRFFENVTVNLGLQVKVFTVREAALGWLGGGC